MHQICKPLDLIIYSLWGEKLFIIGVLIKVLFVLTFLPVIQSDWFVPFIVGWLDNPTSLPWSGHLETNGDPAATIHKTIFRPWGEYTSIAEGPNWKVKKIIVKPDI